ncbi:hypothetical protein Bca101_062305 [Brassica carinata]
MESGGLTKRTPEGEAPELRRRWRQRCGGGGAGGGGGAKRIGEKTNVTTTEPGGETRRERSMTRMSQAFTPQAQSWKKKF